MVSNIIWITLDSIRADHTSLDGYKRRTTPYLDQVASTNGGETFSQCISHGIWSLPSIASMLTGTHPSYHGTGLENEVLPDSIPTVPELLSDAGWRTSAVATNAHFGETTGTDRGFDEIVEMSSANFHRTVDPRTLLRYALGARHHSAGFSSDLRKHNSNYLVNETVKRELTRLAADEKPFFLYTHYSGAHHPYYPPIIYQDAFTDDIAMSTCEASEFAFEHTIDVYREIAEGCEYTHTEWDAISAMYDAAIKHCDGLMRELFSHIVSLDLDETAIIVTADHGDLLGEYDLLSHKLVTHDALVRVPLVVYGADCLVGHGDDLVQHMDIMTTLLEDAGVRTDSLQGMDLRSENREVAFSQRGRQTYEKTIGKVREYDSSFDPERFHSSLLTSLRTTDHKYLRSSEKHELFALPGEENDLAETRPELAEQFESQFSEFMAQHGTTVESDAKADYSEAARSRLRDLGYVVD